MRRVISAVVGMCVSAFLLSSIAVASQHTYPETPEAVVSRALDVGSEALREGQSLHVILQYFDTHEITRQSMDRGDWMRLTEAARENEVRRSTGRMMAMLSSGRLRPYIGADVTFGRQSGSEKYATLTTDITPREGESVRVGWRLRCDPNCKITNIMFLGFTLSGLVKIERDRENRTTQGNHR